MKAISSPRRLFGPMFTFGTMFINEWIILGSLPWFNQPLPDRPRRHPLVLPSFYGHSPHMNM